MAAEDKGTMAFSKVAIDGGHFGGYVKRANRKEARIDRRLAVNQNGKRHVVIFMRKEWPHPYLYQQDGRRLGPDGAGSREPGQHDLSR
jgi:hypothetical protein